MMRKKMTISHLLTIVLTLCLMAGLCACSGGSGSSAPASKAETESTAAPESLQVEEPSEDAKETQTEEDEKEKEPAESVKEETAAAETDAAESGKEETAVDETAAPAQEEPAGEYTAFAMESQGYQVKTTEEELQSVLTLSEGGTGTMTFNGDSMNVSSWTYEDGTVNITMADDSTASGSLKGGVINLDLMGDGSVLLLFAKEGADLSGYNLITSEELQKKLEEEKNASVDTRLYAAYAAMDKEAGVHMTYKVHTETPKADTDYDVHSKGALYYSSRTVNTSGAHTVITFFQDGKVMNLYPDDKTGTLVTETSSESMSDNILAMDSLYNVIQLHSRETEFTEETREVDGTSYQVDVYPAGTYTPEAAFYFNEDGSLACCQLASWKYGDTEIGETFYTIGSIDDTVDESLFDISGYTIGE